MTLADTSLMATAVPLWMWTASYTLPCDPLSRIRPKRYLRAKAVNSNSKSVRIEKRTAGEKKQMHGWTMSGRQRKGGAQPGLGRLQAVWRTAPVLPRTPARYSPSTAPFLSRPCTAAPTCPHERLQFRERSAGQTFQRDPRCVWWHSWVRNTPGQSACAKHLMDAIIV
jgi:hypothetical protein